MPRCHSSSGPENRSAWCAIPAVATLISVVVAITHSSTSAPTVSARPRPSGSVRARRSVVAQRMHVALMPGASGGAV